MAAAAPSLRRRPHLTPPSEEIELGELRPAQPARPPLRPLSPGPSRPSTPDTFSTTSASQPSPPGSYIESVTPPRHEPVPPLGERTAGHLRRYANDAQRALGAALSAARARILPQPPKPDDRALLALCSSWKAEGHKLAGELVAAKKKLEQSRKGFWPRLSGIVPARFLARAATLGAALMLWSAGTVTMLPFLLLATLTLLLWPGAASELSASLKGKPTRRELRDMALERDVYVLNVLVELYGWAERRSAMYADSVRTHEQVCGLPSLDADLKRHEDNLKNFSAALDHEGIKDRLISRLWSHLPLALAWTQAVAVGRIVRQLASLLPLALYLSLLDSGDEDSSKGADVSAARKAVETPRPRYLSRAQDRQHVLSRITTHTQRMRHSISDALRTL